MQTVTTNDDYFGPGQGVYVIHQPEGGYSCLGFDVCLERIERYALDLYKDPTIVDGMMGAWRPKRGQLDTYWQMRELESALVERFGKTGERAVAELSPQLAGLEGWRVEVEDEHEDGRRRFIVGKSSGPIPCHLELARRNVQGGYPARKEYRTVKPLEKVR